MFAEARRMAERTPERRNRAADFFRAVSIVMVVFGHWFLIAPHLGRTEAGGSALRFDLLLGVVPWTQFATWLFQVMPVFFIVGGFANAASWASARRDPERRRGWQAGRLRRLLLPTVPLVAVWCLAAAVASYAGLSPDLVRAGSQAALVPIWFLAVYIMVTVAVPVSTEVWRRFGLASVAALAAAAAVVDLIGLAGGQGWLRWSNYGFVWMAMHQLGYWWHSGRVGRRGAAALLVVGLVTLALLVGPLGYPVSMVTVPGAEVSNSRPPTVAMLGIGCVQGGAMLLLAAPVARWLRDSRRWAVVILAGRMIMTVYLWHITALIALVGLAMLAGGIGLQAAPGEAAWWLWRPVWIVALLLAMPAFLAVFGRFETSSRRPGSRPPGPLRAVLGAGVTCAGLTFLALHGAGAGNLLGVNLAPALLALFGVGLATVGTSEDR